MQPKATLVSWTQNPLETVYLLWQASRREGPIASMEDMLDPDLRDDIFVKQLETIFEKVLKSAIPVVENINFTFLLEGVSISFREQMVRHRVGVKVGERIGIDYFPDIHDSTWWSQSMRVLDMGLFADKGAYEIPESVRGNNEALSTLYGAMHTAQQCYRDLIRLGVPAEDARQVIPLGTQHRISWTLNLGTLAHIVQKRSCWILQLGLWEPIITGMVQELCDKVHPIFSILSTPPCMCGDDFTGCRFELDNEKRIAHEDPLPPCALYCQKIGEKKFSAAIPAADKEGYRLADVYTRPDFARMCKKYESFWRRNVFTGKTLR